MSTATSFLVASIVTLMFLAGIASYATGKAAMQEARASYPGRRERQRAHGWFAIAWACWAADCLVLLALR